MDRRDKPLSRQDLAKIGHGQLPFQGLTTGKRPRFFWQGLMIILPVLVLAVVGLFSLRQDEEAAEQTARKKAAENVESLAHAISLTAGSQIEEYQVLQARWVGELFNATEGAFLGGNSLFTMTNFPSQDLKAIILQWEKANPGLRVDELAAPRAVMSYQGSLLSPADCSLAPAPPKWFLDLSPSQRQDWQTLRQIQSMDSTLVLLASAWQRFLGTNPSKESQGAASNYARLNSRQVEEKFYGGLTESGLRFEDLACLQALDYAANHPWSASLLDRLAENVFMTPSFLTSALFEKADEHPPSDPLLREKLRLMEKAWSIDTLARERLMPIRQHPEFLSANFWAITPSGEALALPADGTPTNNGSPARQIALIWFVPRQVVEAVFARALAENRFLLPDYAAPAISVENEQLALRDFTGPPDEKSLLAAAMQKCGKDAGPVPPPDQITFSVAFYLTSREKMLSAEQHRAHLFGALIGAAVLAALAGLLAARRGFYQQQRLSEMKSNFVSSVSHELRAPIASMRLLSEALERGKISDPAKQQEYFRFLVQESRRLTSLIENVLDFSRIEQGRKEYCFEPADLEDLVGQTVQLMLPYAAERQVPLRWQPGSGPAPQLACDGPALQQALINLIDNAIKHSPAGAVVAIGLESGAASVCLWVEDSGSGIPPEEHEKIFERFYRRGSELRRETQGIGIGLTIVKHIIEAHGGRVRVRSGAGQGSRFTIELPLTPAKEE